MEWMFCMIFYRRLHRWNESAYYGERLLGLAYIIRIIYDFLYDNKASPHHTNTINFVF